MSDIAPIGRPSPAAPSPSGRLTQTTPTVSTTSRGDDKVEFSQASQLLSKLSELPSVREDVVARVKAEINAGTYETPDKLEGALDNIQNDLA